jgi:hypothetical protein
MSSLALFSQATHTLTLIGQKNPTQEHLRRLHDGALSDLVDAIMAGTLPDREALRKAYGLPPVQSAPIQQPEPTPELEAEPVIDPIIRVDRSICPSYPDWMKKVMHPELEKVGPTEYDASALEQWLHDGQKGGKWVEGNKIYQHLKDTDTLKTCLRLRDLEEIQKKGVAFFRKYFKGKAVFGWAGIVRNRNGHLDVPYLYEVVGKVVLCWVYLDYRWGGDNPALRFAS